MRSIDLELYAEACSAYAQQCVANDSEVIKQLVEPRHLREVCDSIARLYVDYNWGSTKAAHKALSDICLKERAAVIRADKSGLNPVIGRSGVSRPAGSLTYGEVDVEHFVHALEKANLSDGEIFWDVGSGTGRLVATAFGFGAGRLGKCGGIELMPGLHDLAVSKLSEYLSSCAVACDLRSSTPECSVWSTSTGSAEPCNVETIVELRCADFQTDKTWLEADVIFFTATCFCLELGINDIEGMGGQLCKLKLGARIILVTWPLELPGFVQVYTAYRRHTSWGSAVHLVRDNRIAFAAF